ncbi:hypothetical protein SBOR_6975 [Sclerotinia borealis F-4128]|uniref:Uncharacterized protein n=1 Tax=Sclerotinia borealis (strain F-4128) TaxID=1432307 RepID=W9C9V6_SCLBF|nr:hypothetical protein SBOR_6975 [Sclerotinia borealis F-4128]
MPQIKNVSPPKKTTLPRSISNSGIPAALRIHTPSDGLYKIISWDLGTGYTSIHTADIEVKSEEFINSKSIVPKHFHRYPQNPNHRPEHTTEVPTVCAHIPGEIDESKAQHRYEVDYIDGETGAVVIDTMKEALYFRSEAMQQNKALKDFALEIPYLVSRYKDTQLAAHPEIWMLADYILWLAQLVRLAVIEEGFQGNLIWICTIPSNWNKHNIKLYTLALDASPLLAGKYILQSEIESAIAGLVHQPLKQLTMKDSSVFFGLDVGKGTSDFSAFRQIRSDPVQVEEIMPPAALFAGSSTVLRLWELHIHELCSEETKEDPHRFKSELKACKKAFTERMHGYTGLSGEETDKIYYICGQDIKITTNQMKSWFDEWMRLTREFLIKQFEKYCTQLNRPPPLKFFLMGGSSNAIVLQKCIRDLLRTPSFRNTELVLLGDFNSATLVAYGATIRAVTSVMSVRKSHYWLGFARKELYNRKKHTDVLDADIVNEDILDENGKMKMKKQVKTIQWWDQPGESCTIDGSIDQMPFIKMLEYFDEEGPAIGQPTDYTVPISVLICSSLGESEVMDNDRDDIANGGAGKRGWSYQSIRPKIEELDFEIDFSPSIPNPLLIASDLVSVGGVYEVNWTIFADYSDDLQMNSRRAHRILFTDLVGVIQQSYDVGNDETGKYVRQNSQDEEAIPKRLERNKTDNDGSGVVQLNATNETKDKRQKTKRPSSQAINSNNELSARLQEVKDTTMKDTPASASLESEDQPSRFQSLEEQPKESQSTEKPDLDGSTEEESISINPEVLLKSISDSNTTIPKPVLEDHADEDEYNDAMTEYIDQLRREELTRL